MAAILIGRVLSFSTDNVNVKEIANLINVAYDSVSLSYTGDDVTGVEYRVGGPAGTVVATLVLTYASPGVLSTVTRS